MNKRIFLFPIIFLICISLTSCTYDRGKGKLCELLFSDGYSAHFDFSITEDGKEILLGSAFAEKENGLCISFSSPEILSGLTVSCDSGGNADTFTFNYYGMKAPLPSGALLAINDMVSFFSDEFAAEIAALPHSFAKSYDADELSDSLIKCISLSDDSGTEKLIAYDISTGEPVFFTVKHGGKELRLDFTKIKRPTLKGTQTE